MDDKALVELLCDMLNHKKKEARYLFIALIAVIVMNLLVVGAFLFFESHMETVSTTTTTQEVEGDDGSIVNGDQYNDESQNRSNGCQPNKQ